MPKPANLLNNLVFLILILASSAQQDDYNNCLSFIHDFTFGIWIDANSTMQRESWDHEKYGFCSSLLRSLPAPFPDTVIGRHFPVLITARSSQLSPTRILALPGNDYVVSAFMKMTGTYDPTEESFLLSYIKRGQTVVEIGANVGAYSIPLAEKLGPSGQLHCFEPFRYMYQILTANVVLNGLSNVYTYNVGIGEDGPERIVQVQAPSLSRISNLGAMRISQQQAEEVALVAYSGVENITIRSLDSFSFSRKIDLLKIDVEGMEHLVAMGARETIKRDRPLIYAENQGKRRRMNKKPISTGLTGD
ncbi:hypothetical protein FOL47_002304 [Perkinsus chesapeaki]|uniref:Methyltransferase FkbM domain-containing protein n=1 Tax=Perkinsus chesapeaki TaxID=330153 RepID=A0A7J6MEG2_PERCH|nr:hypothetical protein FOL47_002304 [Perkinsus chesapeaki]